MAIPSDISRSTEKIQIYFFYIVGIVSLVVNTATLFIIVRKSSALTREVKFLTVFQQLSCLLSNAFLTILFIPFFYLRLGGGYCLGLLCSFVPYQHMIMIQIFLTMCMLSAFGMMIIARQQMLIWDDSVFKMNKLVKYAVYAIINMVMHLWTAVNVLVLSSERKMQNEVLDNNLQIRWRERGLNWFLFYGPGNPLVWDFSYHGFFVQLPAFVLLIVFPFVHMLYIVLQAGNKMQSQRNRDVHVRNAKTIIIQFAILMLFFIVPFIAPIMTSRQEEIYRESQNAIVIAECVFVCSTLVNSIVIVSRTRAYLNTFSWLWRTIPTQRHSIQSVSSVI